MSAKDPRDPNNPPSPRVTDLVKKFEKIKKEMDEQEALDSARRAKTKSPRGAVSSTPKQTDKVEDKERKPTAEVTFQKNNISPRVERKIVADKPKTAQGEKKQNNEELVAKGISAEFREKILKMRATPEKMEFLQKMLEDMTKSGSSAYSAKIAKLYGGTNKSLAFRPQDQDWKSEGVKILKGKPYYLGKTRGEAPMVFDFSILIDPNGSVIALDEHIAGGSFGQVRAAADINDLSKEVVVKVVRNFDENIDMIDDKERGQEYSRKFDKRDGPYAATQEKSIGREIRHHKDNLSWVGYVQTPSKGYIIQKRLSGIELESYIKKKTEKIKTSGIDNQDFLDMLRAGVTVSKEVLRLHERDIIHRDIKPKNILFDDSRNEAHLIDLETMVNLRTARKYDAEGRESSPIKRTGMKEIKGREKDLVFYAPPKKLVGTPGFVSPEIIESDESGRVDFENYKGEFSKASDLYALGKTLMMLYEPLHKAEAQHSKLDSSSMKALKEIDELAKGLIKDKPEDRTPISKVIETLEEMEKSLAKRLQESQKPVLP